MNRMATKDASGQPAGARQSAGDNDPNQSIGETREQPPGMQTLNGKSPTRGVAQSANINRRMDGADARLTQADRGLTPTSPKKVTVASVCVVGLLTSDSSVAPESPSRHSVPCKRQDRVWTMAQERVNRGWAIAGITRIGYSGRAVLEFHQCSLFRRHLPVERAASPPNVGC